MANTEFQNPFKDQFIHFIGKSFSCDVRDMGQLITQAGGHVRSQLNTKTTLVIKGDRPGIALQRAIERGIPVWDVAKLEHEIELHIEHLRHVPRSDQFDPMIPTIEHSIYNVSEMLGLRAVYIANEEIAGDAYSYKVRQHEFSRTLSFTNVESIQGLTLYAQDEELLAEQIPSLSELPLLRALAIEFHDAMFYQENQQRPVRFLDLQPLLEAAPALQSLRVSDALTAQFGVLRHANLEQLLVHGELQSDILLCSFPKLTYLDVRLSVDGLVHINQMLANNTFPRLRHIGLSIGEADIELLNRVQFPETIEALTIHFQPMDYDLIAQAQQRLATLPIAKQITYLSFAKYTLRLDASLSRANYPLLKHFKIFYSEMGQSDEQASVYEQLSNTDIADDLHLDLRGCFFAAKKANQVARWLKQNPDVKSVDLRQNCITIQQALDRLASLTVPVDVEQQYTG